MSPADPRVSSIAADQAGVVTTAQLREAGVHRAQVRAQLSSERWQRTTRGVLLTHNGPPTSDQALYAALLACPPESAISGPTAALLDGYRLGDPHIPPVTAIHITMPAGFRTPHGIGAQIHWSRHLGEDDVHPLKSPRRTRLPRSVLDWAAWQPVSCEHAVRAIILGAVQQGLTTPEQLRAALAQRGHCRHRALIVESIGDAEGGVGSLPEHEFGGVCRDYGLPKPSRQVIRLRPSGRAYLDVGFDDYGYSSEIEGAQHFFVGHREQDLMRLNDLIISGERVLMFTSFAVRRRPQVVAEVLARALRSAGWTG
jgi:hypothetical protein